MDVMMPVMGGLEATRRIRSLPDFAQLPVIMVTASATSEGEAKSYAAGASAFIPKPIVQEALLNAMGERLGLHWIRDAAAREAEEAREAEQHDLILPPREEIEILHRLARMSNMRDISARADYLKDLDAQYVPFARQLRSVAEGYQSKAIVAMIERCRAMQEALQGENPPV
jgi:CheY-like chemotaxis protein